MIQIELKTPVQNVQFRPDLLHDKFTNASSFVFVIYNHDPKHKMRSRLAAPPNYVNVKKLRARGLRAAIVRAALQAFKRQGGPVSWKHIDDAYVAVLRLDGAHNVWLRELGLRIGGVSRRLWDYWRVPPIQGRAVTAQEIDDATAERKEPEGDLGEHSDGDESRPAAETSGGDSAA